MPLWSQDSGTYDQFQPQVHCSRCLLDLQLTLAVDWVAVKELKKLSFHNGYIVVNIIWFPQYNNLISFP